MPVFCSISPPATALPGGPAVAVAMHDDGDSRRGDQHRQRTATAAMRMRRVSIGAQRHLGR